jgi:hypothetical protein
VANFLRRFDRHAAMKFPPPLAPAEFVRSPEALGKVYSPGEAQAYTRWLATHHYENFHVVSFLLPKRLHQDFFNVYAYCRWADDLGDEIGDRAESLRCSSPCAIRWRGTPFRSSHLPI